MTYNTDFLNLTARQLVEGYQAKTFSPVEVTEAALARIEAHNKMVNAFVYVDEYPQERYHDHARQEAIRSAERWEKGEPFGSLDGVPFTVKDLVLTKDWPTLRGSLATSVNDPWDESAPAVERLLEAGAIFLGKTTTPEYGWKGVTESPRTGITRNPWNLERATGGSSGGASVAAALGFGTLHLSNDGGGSSRLPACFCGVVGFKSTFGLIANYPPGHTGTLLHPGITTRTVEDAAFMLNILSRPDPLARDWYALPYDGQDYLAKLEINDKSSRPLEGLRIAYSPTFRRNIYDEEGLFINEEDYGVDSQIENKVKAAVEVLRGLGATVDTINASDRNPVLKRALQIYDTFWRVSAAKLVRGFTIDQVFQVETGLILTALFGQGISQIEYIKAIDEREALGRGMEQLHKEYDLLITPTLPIKAFKVGLLCPDDSQFYGPNSNWTPFTYVFNLTQQPAISVPCGFTEDNLPVGMQIIGAKYNDLLVLQVARAYEKVVPFVMAKPTWK